VAVDSNILLEETRCLGCNSEASEAGLLTLGLWQRLASLADVDEIVDSFVARSGITDATQIAAVTSLVTSARVHGWWDLCDLIYPFVGGTAGTHAQNLKSSSFTITWAGTVTHNANGITGDGTTGFGDTAYIPSSSGQVLVNSVHLGAYRRTTGTSSSRSYSGVTTGLTALNIERAISAANLNAAVHDLLNSTLGPASLAFSAAVRNDSANKHVFTGASDLTSAVASASVPTINLYVLARNNNGVTDRFSNSNLAGLTAGPGITFATYELMKNDWQVFNAALGRQYDKVKINRKNDRHRRHNITI